MKILLAAGGTGGHTLPALSFASHLIKDNIPVTLISDQRGLRNLTPPPALDIHLMALRFYQKRGPLYKILGLCELVLQSLCMIFYFLKIKPSVVVGFGGFPSFPALAAAWLLRIPYVLHEQNAILGRVNRFFMKKASLILTSFPETQGLSRKSVYIGNPVRGDFLNLQHTYKKVKTKTLLIMGGSQGASIFSKVIPEAFLLLPPDTLSNLRIYQQARTEDIPALREAYTKLQLDAIVDKFFVSAAELMAQADLIVCRAGASTLAEIMSLNKKALLIPYPFAMDNHQKINAQTFVEMGYGWMMLNDEFSPELFANWLMEQLTLENELPTTNPLIADLDKMKKELLNIVLEKKN